MPGLGSVLGALPEVSRIQFYRYATASLALPVIVLAALGLDDVRQVAGRRGRLLAASVLAMATVVATELAAQPRADALIPSVGHVEDFFRASIGWGLLATLVVGAAALLSRARLRGRLLAALVVVDAVVLFAVPQFSAPRGGRLDLAPVAYLRHHLGNERFYSLGPIRPNYGSYFGLASLRLDDFPPASYATYVHTRLDPYAHFVGFRSPRAPTLRQELLAHLAGYRAAGVRYVITSSHAPFPAHEHGLRLVFLKRRDAHLPGEPRGAVRECRGVPCDVSAAERRARLPSPVDAHPPRVVVERLERADRRSLGPDPPGRRPVPGGERARGRPPGQLPVRAGRHGLGAARAARRLRARRRAHGAARDRPGEGAADGRPAGALRRRLSRQPASARVSPPRPAGRRPGGRAPPACRRPRAGCDS